MRIKIPKMFFDHGFGIFTNKSESVFIDDVTHGDQVGIIKPSAKLYEWEFMSLSEYEDIRLMIDEIL